MFASSPALVVMAKNTPPMPVMAAYAVFGALGLAVFHFIGNGEFSAIMTISVMVQCLAVCLLALQVILTGSAAGVSVRALGLDALAFALRLSSTTWLNGYLPVDASGDHVYQAIDICSLVIVLWLIYHCTTSCCKSYQQEADTFPVMPVICGVLVLSTLLHADMNDRPIFDTTWMAGLLMGVVAVLPQLWLVNLAGGRMEALTSHYIAMMAASRLLSGLFMWHAREDITCAFWVEGFNHSIWTILGAHAIHLFLLGDFVYFYLKALAKQGLNCQLDLAAIDVV